MSAEWRHNDTLARWELGYQDEAREVFVVGAWVTDETIDRIALPAAAAQRLHARVGSVPPPWAEHIPPPAPIVWEDA